MRWMNRVTLVIMIVGLYCAGVKSGTDASSADKNPCSEDIATFCPNIKPGTYSIMNCLEKNESKLTSACKDYEATLLGGKVERMENRNKIRRFRLACRNDMAKFCNDATSMQGGMLKCLNDHENEISGSCSQGLKDVMD